MTTNSDEKSPTFLMEEAFRPTPRIKAVDQREYWEKGFLLIMTDGLALLRGSSSRLDCTE